MAERPTPLRAAGLAALVLSALAACATGPAPAETSPMGAAAPVSFDRWLASFRAEARAAGVSEATLDATLTGLEPNERVTEANDNQPEFARAVWDYLDSAVSETRVANGRKRLAENRAELEAIERDYGVDAETIVAIWGLESAYGEIMGDYDTFRALATLAWRGRRTAFGRTQLLGALNMVDAGYATREQVTGSWAGAMGHTQFIPTTYLAYAVDRDGDGRRDIWSTLPDVFASTANYLAASGYERDEPWGFEVRLPDGFDYSEASLSVRRPLIEWYAAGVARPGGAAVTQGVDPNAPASIVAPAGAGGPAFIVLGNFRAILAYNRATYYALAISLLSDAVAERPYTVVQDWPRDDAALTLSQRKQLQAALNERGFGAGPVDGIVGSGTRDALRRWQRSVGLPEDGYPSLKVLERLLAS